MFSLNSRTRLSATAGLLAVGSLLAAAGIQAATSQPLVLTAYINGPAGEMLSEGQYKDAVDVLARQKHFPFATPTMKATNRCVAYTITKDLAKAKVACDQAVRAAQSQRPYANSDINAYRYYRQDLAIAYANRSVVRWLEKDGVNAAEDLAKARQLAPKADFIARNLEAVQSRRAVAQVTAVAR